MSARSLEEPMAGAGLSTRIATVSTETTSAAAICAVNWLALTNVVGRGAPFQFTMAPGTKSDPFTVSVNAARPTVAYSGVVVRIAGARFATTNSRLAELSGCGAPWRTAIMCVRAVARSLQLSETLSSLPEIRTVGRSAPSQRTSAPGLNPTPNTLTVVLACPAGNRAGDTLSITGIGEETRSCAAAELPPPGGPE